MWSHLFVCDQHTVHCLGCSVREISSAIWHLLSKFRLSVKTLSRSTTLNLIFQFFQWPLSWTQYFLYSQAANGTKPIDSDNLTTFHPALYTTVIYLKQLICESTKKLRWFDFDGGFSWAPLSNSSLQIPSVSFFINLTPWIFCWALTRPFWLLHIYCFSAATTMCHLCF